MKTKQKDVLYCNVDKDKIKNAKPVLNQEVLGYHHLYLTERHEIYKKKEIQKLPREEWTNDEVFKNYRFTNVRRELDRESKYLIKHISTNKELDLEEKILWSILFRTFNKSDTFERIRHFKDFDIKNITKEDIDIFREQFIQESEKDPKYVWFTPAFNTGGIRASWSFPKQRIYECTSSDIEVQVYNDRNKEVIKEMTSMSLKKAKEFTKENPEYKILGYEYNMPTRMLHLIKYSSDTKIQNKILNSETQLDVYNTLLQIPGFAKFLAYQIFVDLTYIPEFIFSENEFVISGPGCSAGIDLLFEDKDNMNDEECLFWIRDNLEKVWKENELKYYPEELFDHLPQYDRNYNIMMLENSFCELSKLTRAKRGSGRPRVKYIERIEHVESKSSKKELF